MERRGPGDELGVDVAELEAAAVGQGMSYDGALPGVAEWSPGREAPTASELAFGETTPTAQSQPATRSQSDYLPPARLPDRPLPPNVKYDPTFTALALGRLHERNAPQYMRLPPDVVKALDVAWARTDKDRKEHGGNLVRTYGGEFKGRHGGTSGESDGEFWADEKDTGFGGDFLGTFHTHPYEKEKYGFDHGTFSEHDLANLCNHEGRMSIVRSGPFVYSVVKTREFDEKLEREVESETDSERLMEKRESFKHELMRCYNAAYNQHKGPEPAKMEAGVQAVCNRYHLVYYSGQGAQLERKSGRRQ